MLLTIQFYICELIVEFQVAIVFSANTSQRASLKKNKKRCLSLWNWGNCVNTIHMQVSPPPQPRVPAAFALGMSCPLPGDAHTHTHTPKSTQHTLLKIWAYSSRREITGLHMRPVLKSSEGHWISMHLSVQMREGSFGEKVRTGDRK